MSDDGTGGRAAAQESAAASESPESLNTEESRESGADAARVEASVTLLLAAVGRALHYGFELAVLEIRAARRSGALVARLLAVILLCVLSAWLALNAGLVWLAHTRFATDLGITLLVAAGVNLLFALLALWLVKRNMEVLKSSPLRSLFGRR
jgi:hypothetical protein